ncbi:MAG: hypothetical protein RR101_14120 [Burkholderiaceae bacterium]
MSPATATAAATIQSLVSLFGWRTPASEIEAVDAQVLELIRCHPDLADAVFEDVESLGGAAWRSDSTHIPTHTNGDSISLGALCFRSRLPRSLIHLIDAGLVPVNAKPFGSERVHPSNGWLSLEDSQSTLLGAALKRLAIPWSDTPSSDALESALRPYAEIFRSLIARGASLELAALGKDSLIAYAWERRKDQFVAPIPRDVFDAMIDAGDPGLNTIPFRLDFKSPSRAPRYREDLFELFRHLVSRGMDLYGTHTEVDDADFGFSPLEYALENPIALNPGDATSYGVEMLIDAGVQLDGVACRVFVDPPFGTATRVLPAIEAIALAFPNRPHVIASARAQAMRQAAGLDDAAVPTPSAGALRRPRIAL